MVARGDRTNAKLATDSNTNCVPTSLISTCVIDLGKLSFLCLLLQALRPMLFLPEQYNDAF